MDFLILYKGAFVILSVFMIAIGSIVMFGEKKSFLDFLQNGYNRIRVAYANFLQTQEKWIVCTLIGSLLAMSVAVYLILYQTISDRVATSSVEKIIVITTLIWIILIMLIWIIISVYLVAFDAVIKFIIGIDNKVVRGNLVYSFIFSFLLVIFTLILQEKIHDCHIVFLIDGIICYILNMRIMLLLIKQPRCIGNSIGKRPYRYTMLCISILMIFLVVVSLYVLVVWAYYACDHPYEISCGLEETSELWTMFYYTIISFTTIGYGDITPACLASQAIAIVISVTSVICLVVFLNSVLSVQEKTDDRVEN